MIDEALIFLVEQLNNHFENSGENKVAMRNILSQDGSTDHLPDNSVIMTLIGIEEERILKSQVPYFKETDGSIYKANPEVKLNLQILLSAHFSQNNYDQALKFLSGVISFFQGSNVFDHKNSPTLSESIDKLILELVTPSFEQLNHIWGFLGAKYVPSVMYKIRMLTINQHKVLDTVDQVSGGSNEILVS